MFHWQLKQFRFWFHYFISNYSLSIGVQSETFNSSLSLSIGILNLVQCCSCYVMWSNLAIQILKCLLRKIQTNLWNKVESYSDDLSFTNLDFVLCSWRVIAKKPPPPISSFHFFLFRLHRIFKILVPTPHKDMVIGHFAFYFRSRLFHHFQGLYWCQKFPIYFT